MRQFIVLLGMSLSICPSMSMDPGRSGVWDSPMANDYYVRQFGWMFGGGRSGMRGMKAMMDNKVDTGDMKYSSPYKYEYDSQNSIDLFPMPTMTVADTSSTQHQARSILGEKKMVKLKPMMVNRSGKKPSMFQPFMAAP